MMRIAVLLKDRCQPKKCSLECIHYCPPVRTGVDAIALGAKGKPVIAEDLCVGCGICVHKCPFEAIKIIGLPQELAGELVHQYGRMWWLDPGEPYVREYVARIVRDIVRRYDVDAIHFDDYFYPYPEKGVDFPDDDSYSRWNAGMSRDEWRRRNVDLLIWEVSRAIKEEKPNVRFGVSPFGIWRPKHPRRVRGLDAYAQIYADSRKWLQQGWVDYLTPQLYWGTTAPQQRFSDLLRWWRRENRLRIHLWPGLGAHRVANGRPNAFTADEIVDQINLIRRGTKDPGWILFTMNVLLRDRGGLTDKLEKLNARDVPIPKGPTASSRP